MQNQTWWNKWQEQRDMLSAVIPNFNHLPYFLLYSAGHFEALLAAKIEDWTGVDSALSLLQPSGVILQHCFGLNLNEQLNAASSAAGERRSTWLQKPPERWKAQCLNLSRTAFSSSSL
jgi:hypothetical protein